MPKTRCMPCKRIFPSHEDYLQHTCEKSGLKPTEPGYAGRHFAKIQEAALKRGDDRKIKAEKVEKEKAVKNQ